MRGAAQTALAICLTICACQQRPAPRIEARSTDIEVGSIEATAKQITEDTVSVDLRWAFTKLTTPFPVSDLPRVYLSNGAEMLWAVPSTTPEWDDDEVHFNATVDVSREAWSTGCWQASHYTEGAIGSGPITCLNQAP